MATSFLVTFKRVLFGIINLGLTELTVNYGLLPTKWNLDQPALTITILDEYYFITRWVCFNDPAWESSGWGGRVGWVVNIPTSYIQLNVAGSKISKY